MSGVIAWFSNDCGDAPKLTPIQRRSLLLWHPDEMPLPADESLIRLMNRRGGLATLVRLRDGRTIRVFNIAWGYDYGDRYAHVSANVSPSIDTEEFDFFFSFEIAAITDPDSGAVIHDASTDTDAATEWLLHLGYRIELAREGTIVWASLRSIHQSDSVLLKYGGGSSADSAVLSAAQRWSTEQIGNPRTDRRFP